MGIKSSKKLSFGELVGCAHMYLGGEYFTWSGVEFAGRSLINGLSLMFQST